MLLYMLTTHQLIENCVLPLGQLLIPRNSILRQGRQRRRGAWRRGPVVFPAKNRREDHALLEQLNLRLELQHLGRQITNILL